MVRQQITTSVGELTIEIEGQGPPAILWHSLMVDRHQWDRVRTELGLHRTLIVIDGPGHGTSGAPPKGFTFDDVADAVTEVLAHLDIEAVDWVGNAWGGHIGLVLPNVIPIASGRSSRSAHR